MNVNFHAALVPCGRNVLRERQKEEKREDEPSVKEEDAFALLTLLVERIQSLLGEDEEEDEDEKAEEEQNDDDKEGKEYEREKGNEFEVEA